MAGRELITAVAALAVLVVASSLALARSDVQPGPATLATLRPTLIPRSTPSPNPEVVVTYRVSVRVPDGDGFALLLADTMADPRGWSRAGFVVHEAPDAPYLVVLAGGEDVDALCRPYDTGGEFSCQNGPVVAINAERWREAVPHWPLSLEDYRRMLINHEMGHLLGQRHRPCPGSGPAPVMSQQSGGLGGCEANPWPLPAEIARAARHDLELAPAYGE